MSRILDLVLAGTPPQFDNDTSLATTQFVRTVGKHGRNVFVAEATMDMTAAHIGGTLWVGGTTAGINIRLPTAVGAPDGARVSIVNTNLNAVTILRVGEQLLFHGTAGPVTSITLKPGDTLDVEVYGSSGGWMVVGGSALLPKSNQFLANTASNGTQILPSGLIFKWALLTTNGSGTVTWTFNEAFPNGVLGISALPGQANCTVAFASLSASSVVLNTYNAATAAVLGSVQLRPIAIGY